MDRVKGKVAPVTGEAMGMEQAQSELPAAEGAHVFICNREIEKGEAFVQSIAAANGRTEFIRLDVTSENDWDTAIARIKQKAGRLEVLIKNAGILARKPAHKTTTVEESGIQRQRAWPLFRHACRGLADEEVVRLLAKTCAVDLAAFNIHVNSIHPGVLDTPMTKDLLHRDEATRSAILGPTPLSHPCQPRRSRRQCSSSRPTNHRLWVVPSCSWKAAMSRTNHTSPTWA